MYTMAMELDPDDGISAYHLGALKVLLGCHEEGIELYRLSFALFDQQYGADHRYTRSALWRMEAACANQLQNDEAGLSDLERQRQELEEQLAALGGSTS
jgi:hypothetical protein